MNKDVGPLHAMVVPKVFFLFLCITIFILLSSSGKKRKENVLILYVSVMPLWNFMLDLGLQVTLDRVVAIVMFFILITSKNIKIPRFFLPYFIFTIIITLIFSRLIPVDVAKRFTLFRGELRWIGQVLLFFINFMVPLTYIINFCNTPNLILRVFRAQIIVLFILCILGFIQFIVFTKTRIDIFPIGFDDNRSTEFDLENIAGLLRVCSLGGEPKHFAFSLVTFILLLTADFFFGKQVLFSQKYSILFLLVMIATLALTLSTQGYIILPIGIFVMFLVYLYVSKLKINLRVSMAILSIFISVSVLSTIPVVREVLELRIFGRIEQHGMVEDYNLAINAFFADNPAMQIAGVGMGHIHLFAQDYIPDELRYYMVDSVFVAKHGYLKLLTDSGIIGFFLFVGAFVMLVVSLYNKMLKQNKNHVSFYLIQAFILVIPAILTIYMVTYDGPAYIFLFFALGSALLKIVASNSSEVST